MSCFPALPVLLASLTLHVFWSTLGHFEKHPTSTKGNPLTNRSKGGIRIPFYETTEANPIKRSEGNTANPIQSQGVSFKPSATSSKISGPKSPVALTKGLPSKHTVRLASALISSKRWANFLRQSTSVLSKASLHRCFPNLQLFDLSKCNENP